MFEYARSYTPDFASWLTNFGQLAANYDANGHYARVQPMFLPVQFAGGTLTRRTSPRRSCDGFELRQPHPLPGRRSCSPHPTARAPVPVGGDCDPATTPPGP